MSVCIFCMCIIYSYLLIIFYIIYVNNHIIYDISIGTYAYIVHIYI